MIAEVWSETESDSSSCSESEDEAPESKCLMALEVPTELDEVMNLDTIDFSSPYFQEAFMGFCQDQLSAERRIKVLLQDHSTLAAANSELERKLSGYLK